jgi:hypothetical protein
MAQPARVIPIGFGLDALLAGCQETPASRL